MKWILPVIFLVIIDQGIKLYIADQLMNKEYDILTNILVFRPYQNKDYSWVNSMLDMGIGLMAHILLNVIMLAIIFMVHDFVRIKYSMNQYVSCLFLFLYAGGFCSLIDKMAWGGSLDYIWLKGFFIFDLKDVYLSTFEVMMVLGILLKHKEFRKVNEAMILKEFTGFCKKRYFNFRKR
jgi:signal peptidase II